MDNKPHFRFAALITAAGKSSRMGTPKHALSIKNQTFVEKIIHAFLQGGIRQISVTIPDPGVDLKTERLFQNLGISYFKNAFPERELLGSIQSFLYRKHTKRKLDGFFVIPVDTPFLSKELVLNMMNHFTAASSGQPIVVASHKGESGHPVLLSIHLLNDIMALDEKCSLRTLLEKYEKSIIRVDSKDARILANINTQEEYVRLVNPSERILEAAATEAPG